MMRTINRRWLAVLTGGCALLAVLLLANTTPAGAQLRPDPVFECDYRVEADGSISAIIAIANDVPFGDDVTINFRDNRWISTFVPNPDAQADVATVSRIPDIAIIRINDQDRVDIACNPIPVFVPTPIPPPPPRPDAIFECDYRVEADGSISAIIAIANDVPFGDDVTINFRDNRWISTFVPNPDAQADVATVSRIPDIAIIRINDQDRVDIACNPL